MNNARLKAIEDQQTGIARKVLAAVPIKEHWTAQQICSEMLRTGGTRTDFRMVEGCLDSLVNQGLVQERPRGNFQRIAIKSGDVDVERLAKEVKVIVLPNKPDLLTRISNAADILRKVADDIERFGVEASDAIAKAEEGNEKLRALQALLKSIGQ